MHSLRQYNREEWICEMSQDLVTLNAEDSCNPESSAEYPRNRVCIGIFHLNLWARKYSFREKDGGHKMGGKNVDLHANDDVVPSIRHGRVRKCRDRCSDE